MRLKRHSSIRSTVVAAVVLASTHALAGAMPVAPFQRGTPASFDSTSRVALYRVETRSIPALQKQISVSLRSARLDAALDSIAARADIPLTYSRNVLPRAGRVSLSADRIVVEDALRAVLKDAGLDIMALSTGQVIVVRAGRKRAAPAVQTGTVTGRVTDARTAAGLAGVTLVVEGTRLGATSGDSGQYRIPGVPPGPQSILARRLGYVPERRTTTVVAEGTATLDFALTESVASLDQVVVTGTAGGELKRSLGNSVSTVDATQATERSGAADVSKLLNGRVPGLSVLPGSGKIGAGPQVAIRGRSTLSLTAQPIVYVDGIRVTNDIGTGPVSQGSQVVSRLNDLNPEDIQSIEVIKGPAAATLYGTEASNGVIQIITKRGKAGAARWEASIQQGTDWFMDAESRIGLGYARDPQTKQIVTFDPFAEAKAGGTDLFKNGHLQAYNLAVSGGSDQLQYYVAGNLDHDTGIDPINTYKRYGGHMNLHVVPNAKIDLGASANVLTSDANLSTDFGNSPMFSALYGNPLLLTTPKRGFFLAPPEIYYSGVFQNTQAVDRYTASVEANHRPVSWFRQRLVAGIDQTGEDNIALTNFMGAAAAQLFAAQAKGSVTDSRRDLTFQTAEYTGTADVAVTPTLRASTSAGAQYYRRETRTITAGGRDFPGPGVTTVAAAAVPTSTTTDLIRNTTVGVYGQEQLAWRDRLYLTGAVRVDNNSAFGKDFKWATYPKVSLSWVASEEPFFKVPFISTLKFRAAYGASGQQPGVFTALRTYAATAGPNDASAITPAQVGNTNLKPERGQELEAGFEGTLIGDRLSVDFTYFDKSVRDAILLKDNAPSFGFPGQQYVNIGRVDNHGLELQLDGKAITRRNINLGLSLSVATADNEVKDLGGLPSVPVFSTIGQFDMVGFPIGGFFLKKVVSARLDANGKAVDVQCDGGAANGHAPTPCAQAPRVYLGQPTPRVTGAGTGTLRLFDRLQIYSMVDFKGGHHTFDWDRNIRCVQIPNCEVIVSPEKYDPRYVAEVQNGAGQVIASQFVSRATFAKLREVSVAYELPTGWVRRTGANRALFTITGRNLHTWTKFTGIDPESRSSLFTVSEIISLNQAVIPPLAELSASLRLSF
jgi:TonB-linked SusC/RagA family outer membrane protein